jgi:hypothetical protein
MAEFVDNAIQSFLDHKTELERLEGGDVGLRVSIELDQSDGGRITIRDNAAGIFQSEYARAFRPAAIPPDTSGLREFGMGMKSAACWFANRWRVRTSALGEAVERTVAFDVDKIVKDNLEELSIQTRAADPNVHYTEIVLYELHRPPQGRTIGKIKEHLTSIYREFTREGILILEFDGEVLSYKEAKVLKAPFYKEPDGEPVLWRKDINFDFGDGLSVSGFAALFETGSTSNAGFALFRRSRLIQGSADEGYRPVYIFGRGNSYRSQRLFGELHLEGFKVSHTKDGFRWDENEEPFLQLLKEYLDALPLPLLDQAEGRRVRPRPEELYAAAEIANERTSEVVVRDVPPVLEPQISQPLVYTPPPQVLAPTSSTASLKIIETMIKGNSWRIAIELSDDPAVGDWVALCDHLTVQLKPVKAVRDVGIRLSLAHPLMVRFAGADEAQIEALLRVAVGLVLAEIAARDAGNRAAGAIRRNLNELLRDALSNP